VSGLPHLGLLKKETASVTRRQKTIKPLLQNTLTRLAEIFVD